jgi:large subunit ribosomal protein L1
VTDQVLVFAEPNTPSRALAIAQNVQYVGGEDLFEGILNGEIQPTKVLCTPGMLPNVTKTLGRFLGQKGLMPTVKRGGVGEGEELVQRIQEARGAMDWMSTKDGIITARKCFTV